MPQSNKMLRYAIIGCGMMGREHIQNLQLLPGAEVSAICEPDPQQQRLALELAPGARLYVEIDQILTDHQIDAWIIASPNATHAEFLCRIMAAGTRPILVEKPLCTTAQDCRDLLERSANYAAPIWIAMEYRYMPVSQILLQKLAQNQSGGTPPGQTIGALRSVSIREHRFPFLKKVGNWNRFRAQTGGTLVEKCCHFFDLMRLLAEDEIVQVYASGAMDVNFLDESYGGQRPDIIDNAFVVVEFESGKRGFLDLCMFCDGSYFQEEICLLGDEGKLEGKIPGPERLWAVNSLEELGASTGFGGKGRPSQVIFSPRSPKGPICEEIASDPLLQQAGDHHGGTYYQHKYFYEAITANRRVEVSVEDGAKAVWIGLAAQESILKKSAVALKY